MDTRRIPAGYGSNLLPKTGQTTSYRDGDDGYFESGNPVNPRFTDGGNGVIFDRATQLYWVKQPELIIPGAVGVHATNQIQAAKGNWANDTAYVLADLAKDTVGSTYWVCVVAHTSAAAATTFAEDRAANLTYWRQTVWTASAANLTTPATHTWNNAIDRCLALEYAGKDDWRLPNLFEACSLFNCEVAAQTYATYFPTLSGYVIHTSTSDTSVPPDVWSVDYATWTITVNAISATWYVYPVRGGI